LIVGTKARKAFPHIDVKTLLDLLPYSNTGFSATGKYYRIKDIEDIGAEWAIIKKRASEAETQEFKNRKKSETEQIMDHGAFCETWDRDRAALKRNQTREVKEARANELFSKLEALGHHPQDVQDFRVTNSASFNTSVALTEKRWEIIRPQLEAVVESVKSQRLQRERRQIVDQRQHLAETLLKDYDIPSDIPRAFRKPLLDFLDSVSFQSIIHQPNEVSVTASDFQPALDALPGLVANAAKEIKTGLLQRMIDGGATDIDPSSIESSFDKIPLATSVFFCRCSHNGLPVCGTDNLASHRCYPSSKTRPNYKCLYHDHRASNVVAALLAAANMDASTTAEQMDDMDLRFHCPGWLNQPSRLAMNWRDAVRTYRMALWFAQIEVSDQLQAGPWEVFSPEATAKIKEREMANMGDERRRFRCNTCIHVGWLRRSELESHLES
ncbi:hypothetical protein FRC01_011953, partial [Tulasnella sp. 417]